ncbi:SsrA-binding protein SmpB [Candidatus Providencia siddallii]|uniref:SsrA-binding protein n=1 Tax=Candidatus Providencia siddallii TaxID=1715285 RepID=A0ABM9NPN5_9GAMM
MIKKLSIIVRNKMVYYEYFIEKEIEAGLLLQGWEVRALRTGNVNINNSYISLKNNEAYLFGSNFTPLNNTSSYMLNDPVRNRKLLLNKRELKFIYDKINIKGYTVVVIFLYWKNALCKAKIGIAKGKKRYDKRLEMKKREWKINKERILKKRL